MRKRNPHERILWALLIATPMILLCGAFKPQPLDPLEISAAAARRFWALKSHLRSKFDIVLIGDSRTYRAMSPEAMQSVLAGVSILNFGFSSAGFSPPVFSAANGLLTSGSARRAIVLGITPYSLTPEAAKNKHYLSERARRVAEVLQFIHVDPYLEFFAPISPDNVILSANGKRKAPAVYYYCEYHDNGWVASWKVPENPTESIELYKDQFRENRVSLALANDLAEQIRHWRQKGIRVFGLRVPSSGAMENLEDAKSGFPEIDLPRRLAAAGGIWLDFDSSQYHSYDGSHLDKGSAIRFSTDLAKRIRPLL